MLIDILTQRCNTQRLMIAEAYQSMYGQVRSLHLDLLLGQTPEKWQCSQRMGTVILSSLAGYKDFRLLCMSETAPTPLTCLKEYKKDTSSNVSMCEVWSPSQ